MPPDVIVAPMCGSSSLIAALVILASCGTAGSSPRSTPPPASVPDNITEAASAPPSPSSWARHEQALQLRKQAATAAQEGQHDECARLMAEGADVEPLAVIRADARYDAARCLLEAGRRDEAIASLRRAVEDGLDRSALDSSRLRPLHDHAAWPELVAAARPPVQRAAVEDIQIVTSDIDRFWTAYDLAQKAPARRAEIYWDEYIVKGSPGLHDYYLSKIQTMSLFLGNLEQLATFYASIRPCTHHIQAMAPELRAILRRGRELMPEMAIGDVYLLVGPYVSGGAASDRGLLIGIEMDCNDGAADLSSLGPWQRSVASPPEAVIPFVAHELVHFAQAPMPDQTLLTYAIREGMADFIGELMVGAQINQRLSAYANQRERELWDDFAAEMHGTQLDHWLYNGSEIKTEDRPADLGYYVGYRICRAYYRRAKDKAQALREMVGMNDSKAFLAQSGYVNLITNSKVQPRRTKTK